MEKMFNQLKLVLLFLYVVAFLFKIHYPLSFLGDLLWYSSHAMAPNLTVKDYMGTLFVLDTLLQISSVPTLKRLDSTWNKIWGWPYYLLKFFILFLKTKNWSVIFQTFHKTSGRIFQKRIFKNHEISHNNFHPDISSQVNLLISFFPSVSLLKGLYSYAFVPDNFYV